MKKIIFENTIYSLFLYILSDKEWKKNDYLIYGNKIPDSVIFELEKNVENLVHYRSWPAKLTINLIKYFYRCFISYRIFSKYNVCIGNVRDIAISNRNTQLVQVEDGLLTHRLLRGEKVSSPSSIKSVVKTALLRQRIRYPEPNKYLLSKSFNNSDVKISKYEIVNIEDAWSKLNNKEKMKISKIFNFDFASLSAVRNGMSMLITQPLSEEGLCKEKDKIKGYQKVVRDLGIAQKDLVIKPHPADETNYQQLWPESIVLNSNFPAELITLNGFKFKSVITLFSSSVNAMQDSCDKVYYLGTPSYFSFKATVPFIEGTEK